MAFNSTFGAFTSARLGIYASQKGLQVTGNNIANINTIGYTRQRLDQRSLKVGAHDRYQTKFDVNVGNGALCTGVSQIRDPYLDIRYRSEMASVGAMEAKLKSLDDLASVLDEVGKNDGDGVVGKLLSALESALRNDSEPGAGYEQYDSLVRSEASKLVNSLNYYANKLEEIRTNTETKFKQDLTEINKILSNIRDLNEDIRLSDIHGDKALEQRDERNLLIDELSKYMKIDVTYTTESIGGGQYVEKLVIKLGNANPDPAVQTDSSTLIDGIYGTQFSMQKVPTPNPKYDPNFDPTAPGAAPNDIKGFKYLDKNGNPVNAFTDDGTQFYDKDGNLIPTQDILDQLNNNGVLETEIFDANGKPITEINGVEIIDDPNYRFQLDFLKDSQGELKPDITITNPDGTTTKKYENKIVNLDDNDLYGAFQSKREMLTEKGEFASAAEVGMDENAATKRGIPYYQKALDALANKLATVFNESNKGYQVDENGAYLFKEVDNNNDPVLDKNGQQVLKPKSVTYYINKDGKPVDKDGNLVTDLTAGGIAIDDGTLTEAQIKKLEDAGCTAVTAYLGKNMNEIDKAVLVQEIPELNGIDLSAKNADEELNKAIETMLKKEDIGGVHLGGDLFTNRGDLSEVTEPITAANISISFAWSKGTQRIVQSFIKPTGLDTASKDQSNIDHLIVMMRQPFGYKPNEIVPDAANGEDTYFNGDFYGMLAHISSTLANDGQSTAILLENYETSAIDLDSSRDGVSGVDLNDEAMSLMQYQKSYSAACRLMTAIDETLERLINNTGIVGR